MRATIAITPLRMAVRGVHDDDDRHQHRPARDALGCVGRRADRGANSQSAVLVLAGAREVARLLDVLHGDHAAQPPIAVDNQHLLDAMPVQQLQNLCARRVFPHGHELFAWGHDFRYRQVELLLEADVAVSDDSDDLVAVRRDRKARDSLRTRERDDIADRGVGTYGDRVLDDAALVLLDASHLARLVGRGHVLVDDADAAFLRDRDRESRLGDGVHGRGNKWNV